MYKNSGIILLLYEKLIKIEKCGIKILTKNDIDDTIIIHIMENTVKLAFGR